jgi:anti-sigma factor RsiW
MPLAACLVLAGAGGYQLGVRQTRTRDFTESLTSSHVRALMSGHSIDIASTDRHTVKPWFAGKLDFTPPVVDLGADGFTLAGGRVDHIGGRAVAVLVYERRKHLIDVYIAPADAGVTLHDRAHAGFHLVDFTEGGNHCIAVSDLASNELEEFSRLWRAKAAP